MGAAACSIAGAPGMGAAPPQPTSVARGKSERESVRASEREKRRAFMGVTVFRGGRSRKRAARLGLTARSRPSSARRFRRVQTCSERRRSSEGREEKRAVIGELFDRLADVVERAVRLLLL